MPNVPDLNPLINIERDDAVNIMITSIAMEELALAHILNAEGEKLQYVLGTLGDRDPGEITICDIMAVNASIQRTLKDVIKTEMLLQLKLESAILLDENDDNCQLTVRGQKIWRDGNNVAGTRPPAVEISLLRDNLPYRSVTIDSTGNGVYTFPCLPIWKDTNTKYVYQVDELDVPVGYTKTNDGLNIINTVEPGTITIECTKTWDDNENATQVRPASITVILLQNGTQFLTKTIDSPQDDISVVSFTFDNVPQFDLDGNPFEYSLDEDPVTGYDKVVEGFDITNTIS